MLTPFETVFRLLLAAVFGGAVGFERQTHGRPAGFRTHILVGGAAALVMIVSVNYHYLSAMNPAYIRLDPIRLAAGAITGMGFLGAGVIIKSGVNVQGLTTAASLWMTAVIGLATGSGLYLAAGTAFIITYLSLMTLRRVENRMPRLTYRFITINCSGRDCEDRVVGVLKQSGLAVENIDFAWDADTKESTYKITVSSRTKIPFEKLAADLEAFPETLKVAVHS